MRCSWDDTDERKTPKALGLSLDGKKSMENDPEDGRRRGCVPFTTTPSFELSRMHPLGEWSVKFPDAAVIEPCAKLISMLEPNILDSGESNERR
jgi:hypothetical protein